MRTKYDGGVDIPPSDMSLSQATSWSTKFCIYDFDYSRSKQSMIFQPSVGVRDVNTCSTGSIAINRQSFNKPARILLLFGLHRLEKIKKLYEEGDVE